MTAAIVFSVGSGLAVYCGRPVLAVFMSGRLGFGLSKIGRIIASLSARRASGNEAQGIALGRVPGRNPSPEGNAVTDFQTMKTRDLLSS